MFLHLVHSLHPNSQYISLNSTYKNLKNLLFINVLTVIAIQYIVGYIIHLFK